MVNVYNLFYDLEYYGFFDIILPFLLVFAIIFALFEKVSLFGEKKAVNAVVAAVIAFFAVRSLIVVRIIQRFLPRVSLVLVVAIMFFIIAGLFFRNQFGFPGKSAYWVALVVGVLSIIWALFYEFGVGMPYWMYDVTTSRDSQMLLFIGVCIAVVVLIVVTSGKGERPVDKAKDFVNDLFRKK